MVVPEWTYVGGRCGGGLAVLVEVCLVRALYRLDDFGDELLAL